MRAVVFSLGVLEVTMGSKRSSDDFGWERCALSPARLANPAIYEVLGLPSFASVGIAWDISTWLQHRNVFVAHSKLGSDKPPSHRWRRFLI